MANKQFYVDAHGSGNKLMNWILDPSNDFTQIDGVKSIDSLSLAGNTLSINFTKFNGTSGVKSVDLSAFSADINVDAVSFTNPSAGVWNLTIKETDETEHTVNLADLVAAVTLDSDEIDFVGNGTVGTPLTANIKTINAVKINYDNSSSGLTSTDVQSAIDELAGSNEKWASYRISNPTGAPIILTLPFSMADPSAFQLSAKDVVISTQGWSGTEIVVGVQIIDVNTIKVLLNTVPSGELHIDVNYWTGGLVIGTYT